MVCKPIFKKEVKPQCDEECEKAFDRIKEYLSHLPMFVPLQLGILLILHLATAATTIGVMLAQKIKGEERIPHIWNSILSIGQNCPCPSMSIQEA